MAWFLFAGLLLILLSGPTSGQQFPPMLLKELREIKLLEANRGEIQTVLLGYDATSDDGHYQEFSSSLVEVRVHYSSGTCSDDSENDEYTEAWKVPEWKVVRIQLSPEQPLPIDSLGFDLSKFRKEQKYPEDEAVHIYHDKSAGIAVEEDEDGVQRIIFFPPRAKSNKLCAKSNIEKEFYSENTWFTKLKPSDRTTCFNGHADVTELDLSIYEIDATSRRTIEISATAVDPENDVLTYNYTVAAGRIVGRGAKVLWDLTGVPAGTYSITAGVDDGCGICGRTMTKNVTVK